MLLFLSATSVVESLEPSQEPTITNILNSSFDWKKMAENCHEHPSLTPLKTYARLESQKEPSIELAKLRKRLMDSMYAKSHEFTIVPCNFWKKFDLKGLAIRMHMHLNIFHHLEFSVESLSRNEDGSVIIPNMIMATRMRTRIHLIQLQLHLSCDKTKNAAELKDIAELLHIIQNGDINLGVAQLLEEYYKQKSVILEVKLKKNVTWDSDAA